MADEESSRLLENSEDFRTCSIAKNSCHYTPNTQYCAGVPDTISDGDNRGRDPQDIGGEVGTQIDIKMRECSLAKNADRYTPGNEYLPAHEDTLSDGDCRGRDPEIQGGSIGTNKDIETRNKLMAKNADGYTFTCQYCAGVADTVADGDDKGREPEPGEDAGTCIDFAARNCSIAKNANLYTPGNEYCAGSSRV
jgi:hypothetical protein